MLGKSQWLGSLPLDFYSPETFGFLALLGLPHLALGRALLLWGFWVLLQRTPDERRTDLGDQRQERVSLRTIFSNQSRRLLRVGLLSWDDDARDGVRAGGAWLLLGLMNPLTVLVAWGIAGAYLAATGAARGWRKAAWWKSAKRVLWAGAISSPLIGYTTWRFSVDPFLRQWTSQNRILSPHPAHYLLAYGVLAPLAFFGARRLLARFPWRGWLPVAWTMLIPALAYAPYNLQRRLPEGAWVALIVLALAALERVGETRAPRRYFIPVLVLLFPSTLILYAGSLRTASRPAEPAFRPAAEVAAFKYLEAHSQPNAVVLAAFETGNALPAWAAVHVVIGHGPESVRLEELRERVAAFYDDSTTDAARLALLRELGVDYVFWGPAERALGNWDPGQAGYLQQVYAAQGVALYRTAFVPAPISFKKCSTTTGSNKMPAFSLI